MARKLGRISLTLIAVMLVVTLVAGCGQKQQPAPTPQPQQQNKANLEDHGPILNQMNSVLDQIENSAKASQWAQAKQAAATLNTLNDRLAVHFTDTAFRDSLTREVKALNEELNKATPNQATVSQQTQKIRDMLKQAPTKITKH